MASATKTLRDKPYAASPRLMPRPTAASAARAARNATNRNLTTPVVPTQRLSPNRISSSPNSKGKNAALRISQRNDSKTDVKASRSPENELSENFEVEPPEIVESYVVIDDTTLVVSVEMPEQNAADDLTAGPDLQEINENDVFEINRVAIVENPNEAEIPTGCATAERVRSRPQTPSPSSRPQTPSQSSRPQTPKSLPSSRPQTPRMPSRPTTPAYPVRHSTPASRPNTPHTTPRPVIPAQPPKTPLPYLNVKDDTDIKAAFVVKQRQFHRMKKELDMKQQAVLEVFDTLLGLRERMSREGVSAGGEGMLHELVVFNVGDWTAEEVAQLVRDATTSSATDGAVELINSTVPIEECALADLDEKVSKVPSRFADLCLQAFTARQELIDWVKELIENNKIKEVDDSGECLERIARFNSQGLHLCEALRELKSRADDAVDTVTQLSRRAFRERTALIAVGESLVREIAKLRQDIDSRASVVNEMREIRAESETAKTLEEARRELEEERAAKTATKDKLATTESQLRQTRIRVNKMDRQLREAEASIASLTSTVKTLEDQSRQREVQLEARARKLKESVKTGEVTSGQLAQQRDLLQNEITELKKKIETLTTQHKAAIQELINQLNETKSVFEEQKIVTQQERQLKDAAEAALVESQNMIEDMRAKISELENSRPNPDLPTEREMDLWAELQATKDTLRITEDEVTSCKREKIRFLETLTKIAESDNKVGMQQKLAAELLSKEEIMGKMQIQIRELTKNIKLNEQKVAQYEQYVRDLQDHNRAVANCQECPNGISYQDLQQEIMNLKMNLLEAVHRNDELSEALLQKDQQLEQQDKTSRAQARVIKVREELINMLKNKETEQSRALTALQQDLEHRMQIVDEVNKQIAAKAEEIQELFATLENKQQQIHRLEKIVLALEEQHRRAQAQRTRHEEKIAALEHELAAGGNRRERKFLFF